jgi:hypothetical protein
MVLTGGSSLLFALQLFSLFSLCPEMPCALRHVVQRQANEIVSCQVETSSNKLQLQCPEDGPPAASPNNYEHAMILASARTTILHGLKFTEMR